MMGLFSSQTKTPEPEEYRAPEPAPVEEVPLPEPRNVTVIASGVTVTGNLQGNGTVQVEGVLEGEIRLEGAVTVTSTGLVKGPVEADVVHIAGRAEGNIQARDHLRLESSGTIEGDVTSVSFVIEDGGCLNGRSTMIRPQAVARRSKPAPVPGSDLV